MQSWLITFNGNVSLRRLGRIRERLLESPFTIDCRFTDVAEGLIVMHVDTADNLMLHHLEWLLRQLTEAEGLESESVIVSPG